jgi:hypothetical protein
LNSKAERIERNRFGEGNNKFSLGQVRFEFNETMEEKA